MHVTATGWIRRAAVLAIVALMPVVASAQTQLPPGQCDFDVADDLGRFTFGSTIHVTGRSGSFSNRGEFFLINADTIENDVDHDGYNQKGTGCDFPRIYTPFQLKRNLVNVDNPSLAIPFDNIIIVNLPRILRNGTMARVETYVDIPRGTQAGTYIGEFQIRDSIRGVSLSPNNEVLAQDRVFVEVRVLETRDFAIVDADSAVILDSLVIRGRAGQRASGAVRIANLGNTTLSDVRITPTDLRSESAVGLVIPAQNISVSQPSITSIQFGDTARVVVTVQIPRGILGGRYRGALIVQGADTPAQQIPLIVIVTSTRGILFGNNPVRETAGDIANIAFNGDPGTDWKLTIYDMAALVSYKTSGRVFAGAPVPGGPAGTLVGADFAVNVIWPLRNGRGEAVASGMYLVVVESIVNGRRQLAQDKLMVIR